LEQDRTLLSKIPHTARDEAAERLAFHGCASLTVRHCRTLSYLQQDFGNPKKKGIKPIAAFRTASLTISSSLVEHQNHLQYRHVPDLEELLGVKWAGRRE
jgi:hypothetical protein